MDIPKVQQLLPASAASYGVATAQPEQKTGVQVQPVPETGDVQKENTDNNGQKKPGVAEEEIRGAVDKLNKAAQMCHTKLRFRYDEESEEMYVYVIDTSTNEVISRMPPEDIIKASSKLDSMVGLFFDTLI